MNKQINDFKDILSDYYDKDNLINEHLYINIFAYDKDYYVRWYVTINTTDKLILEHLCNDIDEDVRNKAKERLSNFK